MASGGAAGSEQKDHCGTLAAAPRRAINFLGWSDGSGVSSVARMPGAIEQLSDKQRDTLRLIARGHDAKSCARELDLSVHTINERLRDARRILGVSSSREAARMLLAHEGEDPQFLGDTRIGDAGEAPGGDTGPVHNAGQGDGRRTRRAWLAAIGVIAMSILAALAFGIATPGAQAPAIDAQVAAQDAALEAAARRWLELAEAGDYAGSYAASSAAFRNQNTLEGWSAAAKRVRADNGTAISRELVGVESVPTPPDGNEIVIFQTKYSVGGAKVETIALVREGGAWKVAGAYVE